MFKATSGESRRLRVAAPTTLETVVHKDCAMVLRMLLDNVLGVVISFTQ